MHFNFQKVRLTTRLHKESTRNHRELVAYYEVVDSITKTRTIPIGVAYWLLVGVFRYEWSFVWVGVSHKEWEGLYDLNTYSKVLTLLLPWVDGRPAVYGVYEWIYTLVALPLLEGHLASRTEWVVADVGQWRITRNRTIIPRRRTINWGTKASVGHIGITWSSHCNTVSPISHSLVSRQFRGGAVVHLFANTTALWRLMEQFAAYNSKNWIKCSANKTLNPAKVIVDL